LARDRLSLHSKIYSGSKEIDIFFFLLKFAVIDYIIDGIQKIIVKAIKHLMKCDQMTMRQISVYNIDLLILKPVKIGLLPDNEYCPGLLYDLFQARINYLIFVGFF
jgi:hypothetical protein